MQLVACFVPCLSLLLCRHRRPSAIASLLAQKKRKQITKEKGKEGGGGPLQYVQSQSIYPTRETNTAARPSRRGVCGKGPNAASSAAMSSSPVFDHVCGLLDLYM